MRFLKEKKGIIISFIIGVIIASSITVYATSYFAKDITYKDGKNVEQALNELYNRKATATLLWTNSNLTSFSGGTIELDLSEYDYIVIDGNYSSDAGVVSKSLIKKGSSQYIDIGTFYNSSTNRAVSQIRLVTVNNTGVTFGEQLDYGSNGKSTHGIPYHIWGLKLNEF